MRRCWYILGRVVAWFAMHLRKITKVFFQCLEKIHMSWSVNHERASQWLNGKESACQCKRCRDLASISRLGRSLGGGHGNSLQYSCLENPMDGGIWKATVHEVTKSQTWLNDWAYTHINHKIHWMHRTGIRVRRWTGLKRTRRGHFGWRRLRGGNEQCGLVGGEDPELNRGELKFSWLRRWRLRWLSLWKTLKVSQRCPGFSLVIPKQWTIWGRKGPGNNLPAVVCRVDGVGGCRD